MPYGDKALCLTILRGVKVHHWRHATSAASNLGDSALRFHCVVLCQNRTFFPSAAWGADRAGHSGGLGSAPISLKPFVGETLGPLEMNLCGLTEISSGRRAVPQQAHAVRDMCGDSILVESVLRGSCGKYVRTLGQHAFGNMAAQKICRETQMQMSSEHLDACRCMGELHE